MSFPPLPIPAEAVAVMEWALGQAGGETRESLEEGLSSALAVVLADDMFVRRMAIRRFRAGASGMPWRTWREVPQNVRAAFMADARKDLAAVLGGEEEAGEGIASSPPPGAEGPDGGAPGQAGAPSPAARTSKDKHNTEAMF